MSYSVDEGIMNQNSDLISDFFKNRPAQRLGAGQIVLRPGDSTDKLIYIVEGTITQYDITSSGDSIIITTHSPGTIQPLSCAINGRPVEYFYEASSPSLIKQVAVETWLEFISANSNILLHLLKQSHSSMDGVFQKLKHSLGGSAMDRLVYELINAAIASGDVGLDGAVFVPLSQNDLSKRTGLARETVNRTIQKLKLAKILEPSRSGMKILSFRDLERSIGD